MGTLLDARVEISYSPGNWQCVSVWELQKDYMLMMWLSKHTQPGWPEDFDDFPDSDIWEQRSHIDGHFLMSIENEQWAQEECDSHLWRSLIASMTVWGKDTIDYMPVRVLFSKN